MRASGTFTYWEKRDESSHRERHRLELLPITTHYIDGAFVESHGREVMDVIKPTNRKVIAKATLGDEEDTRRAIAAAKGAFTSFSHTTREERARVICASYIRLSPPASTI